VSSAPTKPTTILKFRRKIEGDQPAVLRWQIDTFNGRPFVAARIWGIGVGDKEFPTKHGITIREIEIDQVIEGLMKARDKMRGGR
jgi:hypothetical protein